MKQLADVYEQLQVEKLNRKNEKEGAEKADKVNKEQIKAHKQLVKNLTDQKTALKSKYEESKLIC